MTTNHRTPVNTYTASADCGSMGTRHLGHEIQAESVAHARLLALHQFLLKGLKPTAIYIH